MLLEKSFPSAVVWTVRSVAQSVSLTVSADDNTRSATVGVPRLKVPNHPTLRIKTGRHIVSKASSVVAGTVGHE